MTRARDQAAEAYAKQLERQGPAWKNIADAVRSGYRNMWIEAALDVLTPVVLLMEDVEEEDSWA